MIKYTAFHFWSWHRRRFSPMFFEKVGYGWPVTRTVYNQKSHFLLVGFVTAAIYSPLNTKFSFKFFHILFLFQTTSIVMPKNINKIKQRYKQIEKYQTISMKFRIRTAQLITKFELKQRSFNPIRYHFAGHSQIWKKVFQWLSKSKFLSFMAKVNPENGNETKSGIFSWDIFKSDVIYFFIKKD